MKDLLKHISELFKGTFAKIKEKFKTPKKSPKLGLKTLFRFLILMLALLLLGGKNVSCRSPTAKAQGNLDYFSLAKPSISISHSVFINNPLIKTIQVDFSFDYEGNVFYYVGSSKFQIGDYEGTVYPSINVSASNFGINSFTSLPIRVSVLHTIDADLWEEGITNFSYNPVVENTGYAGIHYQFNLAYDITILFDANLPQPANTNSVVLTSEPTIKYLYDDIVYDNVYNYGYIQGSNVGSRPLKFIANTVNDFLQIELVAGVEVGYLIYLGFGIILFNFVVKLLLGG